MHKFILKGLTRTIRKQVRTDDGNGINLKLLAKSAYLWADALIEESRK
mgnify:CR=1 FL=1